MDKRTGNELLQSFVGKWEGDCKTWFQPGRLADESAITGEFVSVMDGRFVRHTYKSALRGKSRAGEELLAFNAITKHFQVSWVDDFHMNYAIMFSEGETTEAGFTVRGDYDVAPDQPAWGWRTDYRLIDEDHLSIIAYNVHPDGMEAKAVEVTYTRAK